MRNPLSASKCALLALLSLIQVPTLAREPDVVAMAQAAIGDRSEEEGRASDSVAPDAEPVPREIDAAIRNAMEILLRRQESLDDPPATPREWPYEGVYRERDGGRSVIPWGYRIGGTSLVALALLEAELVCAAGATPEDGDTKSEISAAGRAAIERAIEFLGSACEREDVGAGFSGTYDVRGWGHACALWFTARALSGGVFNTETNQRLRRIARSQLDALRRTQLESGGWNYSRPRGAESAFSTFQTAFTAVAFEQARAAELEFPSSLLADTLRVLQASGDGQSAYPYSALAGVTSREPVPATIGRSPLCESVLLDAGRSSPERVQIAIDAFFRHWEELEARRKKTGTHAGAFQIAPYYFAFAHWGSARAIARAPAAIRSAYRDRLWARLTQTREPSGGWNDRVFPRSESVCTALVLLGLLEVSGSRADPAAR